MDTEKKMEYRHLGATGLKVSVFGFGNWITSDDPSQQERTNELVKKAWSLGINYFDTAEMYGAGNAEILLGNAFKELKVPREDLVVSTKIFFGPQGGQNATGLSRKKIIESTNASLKRLQLDYVDIIFAHAYDYNTPVEETCRAFDYLINKGKAFYWGTSSWPAQRIMEAIIICEKKGLIKPIVEQCEYNMLNRQEVEKEYGPLFDGHGYGTTIYSPLAGGFLTGKYNDGNIPEDSRYANPWCADLNAMNYEKYFESDKKEDLVQALNAIAGIAKELDCTQAQLSLAWAIANRDVSTAILGATKESQLEENVKAVEVIKKITPQIEERIRKILKNDPDQFTNYSSLMPYPPRRSKYIK